MFHKTSVRLTLLYLAIIMLISLFFSTLLYGISAREFDRGFRGQETLLDNRLPESAPPVRFRRQLMENRQEITELAKNRVLTNLIFMNLGILVFGGGLSYVLARRTLKPIEQTHKSLEQFTADASHELRTPLANMQAEIEVALMQPKLEAKEAKAVLQSNLEEIADLTNLTEGLLSLARRDNEQIQIEDISIKNVIQNAVEKVQTAANKKHIEFFVSSSAKSGRLHSDKSKLTQVLTIILDNAIKYSPKNGKVNIKTEHAKDRLIISVTDYGPGIAPEHLPKIFDRFYRADQSRSKGNVKGHGLGLAIAKDLVERINGQITIKSDLGKSTTVDISLPIR